jgi:hypothetical protein
MNYKKKRLTDAQFQINCRQKYDSKVTDNFLKENGLNPDTFAILAPELIKAQLTIKELEKDYSKFLSQAHIEAINKFNEKLSDSKKRRKAKPALAYQIFNMASKIKRQAHKEEILLRQKVQAIRYNQP